MHDRNGAELKVDDDVDCVVRGKVRGSVNKGRDVEVLFPCGFVMTIAKPEQLTKVQPEWEWHQETNGSRNVQWRLTRNGKVTCYLVHPLWRNNRLEWFGYCGTQGDGNYHLSAEAAKAAALAACRSAAEGEKE